MAVFIGMTPGGETLQGTTPNLTAQFTQATPLSVGGATPQIRNLTACRVVANDAGFPTGTGYNVSLTDASGNSLFSYSQLWQFFSPGSAYNLSQGIPYYHGQVTYPIPILTIPYNHNPQSISGPLSLSNYNLYNVAAVGVGTATPAWGVDVEGTDLLGEINAVGGYLVNGAAGMAGQCLASDGTAFDTPIACLTGLPTLFYQTDEINGTAVAQQPVNNFVGPFTMTPGIGRTNIGLATTGTESEVVTAAAAGTNGNCAQWDGLGGIAATSAPCFSGAVTQKNCLSVACAGGSTYTSGTTYTNSSSVPVLEEVTMSSSGGGGCVGNDSSITSIIGGVAGPANWVSNACTGQASVTFMVPVGATFSATATHVDGSGATATLTGWLEVSL
jgi:hypothetical protein